MKKCSDGHYASGEAMSAEDAEYILRYVLAEGQV
jgi:hypothetical protein